MAAGKRDCPSSLQTLLVSLILNVTAKMKLAILACLCCGEILKNSNVRNNFCNLIGDWGKLENLLQKNPNTCYKSDIIGYHAAISVYLYVGNYIVMFKK